MKTLSISLSIIFSLLTSSAAFASSNDSFADSAVQEVLTVTVTAQRNPADYEVFGWEKTEQAIDTAFEIMQDNISLNQNFGVANVSEKTNVSI